MWWMLFFILFVISFIIKVGLLAHIIGFASGIVLAIIFSNNVLEDPKEIKEPLSSEEELRKENDELKEKNSALKERCNLLAITVAEQSKKVEHLFKQLSKEERDKNEYRRLKAKYNPDS